MLIVNPAFGRDTGCLENITDRPFDWRQDPIALFSNSKPNAKELLEGVREALAGLRNNSNIGFVKKDSVSQPAPGEVIEHIAANYRGALMAIAD